MLRYSIDEGRFVSQDISAAFRFLEKGKVVLNFNQLKKQPEHSLTCSILR